MNKFLLSKNNIFRKIKTPELLNQSLNQKYNKNKEKIQSFIIYKGLEYFKLELPYLPITEYSIQKSIVILSNYIFVILKSKIALTHPFVVFANIDSNIINVTMTFGKENKLGQYKLDEFENILNIKWITSITPSEYYAIYLLIADSIQTRKLDLIIHDKFSLLKCSNIKQCIITTSKIKREYSNKSVVNTLIKEKELYYKKKAITILEKFFQFLDEKNFEEAYLFLKSEKIRKGNGKGRIIQHNKYFGKERLDTFFKSNKKLIGHLHIFIDLYQFIHLLISRLS